MYAEPKITLKVFMTSGIPKMILDCAQKNSNTQRDSADKPLTHTYSVRYLEFLRAVTHPLEPGKRFLEAKAFLAGNGREHLGGDSARDHHLSYESTASTKHVYINIFRLPTTIQLRWEVLNCFHHTQKKY